MMARVGPGNTNRQCAYQDKWYLEDFTVGEASQIAHDDDSPPIPSGCPVFALLALVLVLVFILVELRPELQKPALGTLPVSKRNESDEF
jgi:hypothetical protein